MRFYLFFVLTLNLLGQVPLRSDQMLRLGEEAEYKGLSSDEFDPEAAGANQVWDFSQFALDSSQDYVSRMIRPSDGQHSDLYRHVDIVTERQDSDASQIDYVQKRGDRFFIMGTHVSNVGQFTSKDLSYFPALPKHFGETRVATIDGSYAFEANNGAQGTSTLLGTCSAHYDGFGTLHLPGGTTFENVARVKLIREWHETSVISGTNVETDQKQIRYHFLLPGQSSPLFEYVETEQHVTPEGGSTTSQFTKTSAYRSGFELNFAIGAQRANHVTVAGGAFQTQVILVNHHSFSQSVTLFPYDLEGNPLPSVTVSLLPNQTMRELSTVLLPSGTASFQADQSNWVDVWTGYKANRQDGSTAHLPLQSFFRNYAYFFPGHPNLVFDGQATININPENLDLGLELKAASGNILDSENAASLGSSAKSLALLADFFTYDPPVQIGLSALHPFGNMVLRISEDFRFLYQNVPVPVAVDSGAKRWLPHITNDNGGFSSEVILTNFSEAPQSVTLTPYNPSGEALDPVSQTLEAGAFNSWTKSSLFPAETSHVSIEGSSLCIASVAYKANIANSSAAIIHETGNLEGEFYLLPGEWTYLFDGMAMVNGSSEAAEISATQISDQGEILAETILVNDLVANGKHLVLFETLFNDVPGSRIQIKSDQPLAVMALRISKDNRFLYANPIK